MPLKLNVKRELWAQVIWLTVYGTIMRAGVQIPESTLKTEHSGRYIPIIPAQGKKRTTYSSITMLIFTQLSFYLIITPKHTDAGKLELPALTSRHVNSAVSQSNVGGL